MGVLPLFLLFLIKTTVADPTPIVLWHGMGKCLADDNNTCIMYDHLFNKIGV